jgi:hypothetical protein
MINRIALATFLFAGLANLPAAAQRVAMEPVKANLDRDWLYEIKESRGRASAVTEADARRIAADMAASLQKELEGALREHGLEVAPAPAASLRLVVSIDNLYVNAAESGAPGVKSFTREAGRATLRAEARDAKGAVIFSSEQQTHAGDTGRLRYTTDVSNRFWFDAAFRGWSAEVARGLKAKAS